MEIDLTYLAEIHWKSEDGYTGVTKGEVFAPNEKKAIAQCKAVIEDESCHKQLNIGERKGVQFVKAIVKVKS